LIDGCLLVLCRGDGSAAAAVEDGNRDSGKRRGSGLAQAVIDVRYQPNWP